MDNNSKKDEKNTHESFQNLNEHLTISPKINKTSTFKKKLMIKTTMKISKKISLIFLKFILTLSMKLFLKQIFYAIHFLIKPK